MSKAVKLVNNQYLSTQYVVHKRGGGWYYLNNLLDNIYPIGSIFISTNTTNPSTYFGGTWERIKGRFLLAADDSAYKIGSTGGEATHKLTIDEMPKHNHTFEIRNCSEVYSDTSQPIDPYYTKGTNWNSTNEWTTSFSGNANSHNNMPPYLVVYIWKRIS